MAVELGKAYVQIVPSLRGMSAAIEKELGATGKTGSVSHKAGLSIGKSLQSGINKNMKRGLIATGISAGAALSFSIKKGFGRLNAFEQAKVSLEGMGLAANQVAEVMSNANKAVEGTAFGLDEAATAAKGMVAAGVKPGKELTRVLSLVGDSAAQTGSSMKDMGVIWGQIAAKGRLQGSEALQLMERGIPIYQLVAKELSVTTEEAMKLGEQGKISFETFAKAIEGQFAGSALKAGDTVTGAFSNVKASLGRLGQGILAGPFADLPAFFKSIKSDVDAITPAIAKASDSTYKTVKGLGEILSGKSFSSNLLDVYGKDAVRKIVVPMVELRGVIGETRGEYVKLGKAVQGALEPFGGIDKVSATVGVFKRVATFSAQAAGGIARMSAVAAPLITYSGQVVAILGDGLLSTLEAVTPGMIDLAEAVVKAGTPMGMILVPAAKATTAVVVPLATAVGKIADVASNLPGPVLAAGAAFISLKAGIGPLPALLKGAQSGFGLFADGVKKTSSFFGHYSKSMVEASRKTVGFGQAFTVPEQNIISLGASVEGASVKIGGAGKALGKFGRALKGMVISNAPLLALTAVVSVISAVTSASQRAQETIQDLKQTFGELGQVTDSTFAKINEELGGVNFDALEKAGISSQEFFSSIAEGGKSLEALKGKISAFGDEAVKSQTNIVDFGLAWAQNELGFDKVSDSLDDMHSKVESAREAWVKEQAAREAALPSYERTRLAIERVMNAERARQDALLGAKNAKLAARQAERDYADAVSNAAKVMQDANATANDRQAAWDRITEAATRSAQAQAEAGASQETINATLAKGKEDFLALAGQMGKTTDEASKLWDELAAGPDEIKPKVELDTDLARLQLGDLLVTVNRKTGVVSIDGDPTKANLTLGELIGDVDESTGTVTIDGQHYPADLKLQELLENIAGSAEKVTIDGDEHKAKDVLKATLEAIKNGEEAVTIDGTKYKAQEVLTQVLNQIGASSASVAIGGDKTPFDGLVRGFLNTTIGSVFVNIIGKSSGLSKADGGLVSFYANGGIRRENHIAQIAPAGAFRVWAEPETAGEAYIPLAVSKRKRSLEILGEVANRFGMQVSRYADGGITTASAGPGVSFHIGAINNPLREPSSTSLSKELAKVSAGVGSLV
ncbi:tape measure protein [Arcanobacterium phocae]|uniref:tape measure protein n=1 Tax=Arcanobacterium phocae TaxID=131112 RepID=UPI001C0E9D88|nr:tape measure protein [Arcanobacterium phocae]